MSEAQKDITIVLGSAGLTYNTKEGDQVVSVKKSELDAKSEEFESVSISLKRLREENAALSDRLKEAEAFLQRFCTLSNGLSMIFRTEDAGYDLEYAKKYAAKLYMLQCNAEECLSKTPKKDNT